MSISKRMFDETLDRLVDEAHASSAASAEKDQLCSQMRDLHNKLSNANYENTQLKLRVEALEASLKVKINNEELELQQDLTISRALVQELREELDELKSNYDALEKRQEVPF